MCDNGFCGQITVALVSRGRGCNTVPRLAVSIDSKNAVMVTGPSSMREKQDGVDIDQTKSLGRLDTLEQDHDQRRARQNPLRLKRSGPRLAST